MKKILLSFIVGILCGVAILYIVLLVSGETVTSLTVLDDQAPPSQTLATTPYTHKAEGKQIQQIDSLQTGQLQSNENASAQLYHLKKMCKLVIDIQGDTYQAKKTAYFHNNRLIRMLQTEYRSSHNAKPNGNADESELIYTETNFNPDSALIQNEFKDLLKSISPENQKKC